MSNDDLLKTIYQRVSQIDYVRPEDLPEISLYMDQLIRFMNSHLANARRHDEDKILTKAMINNYAKNELLPPPEKKRYSTDHLILLVFIYYYKGLLSMDDIQTLLTPLKSGYYEGDPEEGQSEGGKKRREKKADRSRTDENGARYADLKGQMSLKEIYESIYGQCRAQSRDTMQDIIRKYRDSKNTFSSDDSEENTYLHLFSFICAMSFDISLKRAAMDTVISYLLGDARED